MFKIYTCIFTHSTLGDSIESDDPCEKNCTCYLVNREYKIQCDLVKCPAITCKNPRIVEGECCPVCDGK